MLSVGGSINIKEKGQEERSIGAVDDLPPRAFEITGVKLPKTTMVNDEVLAHFKECKNLMAVVLKGTIVSDAGLEKLADCPTLDAVHVENTKVSEAGVKKLSVALPECTIRWNGGVIEP